jgi:hypothetical protein|tara:strand:- start:2949 stop:3200 length:252 start_codon:yes stop_codon:yes gene_type:complete
MDLKPGTFLYDVDEKSFGVLIQRYWSYEGIYYPSYGYSPALDTDYFKVWIWDIVWSKPGLMRLSETGLINLIKADIIIILEDT